ncbi:MAG: septum site-determining protein MinC [Fusobacteriales bacterium]|nr:MAG: septum site-determining protein MinC [Fusobacteriales bacterium]
MSGLIVIKGRKDRLEINLNPDVEFLELCENLGKKIIEAKSFIGASNYAIEFVGRALTQEEENELILKITANSDINITYVFSEKKDLENFSKNNLIKTISEEGMTYFYQGTLRSGGNLEYDGNLVLIGDVNPGAVVRARGNVLVIGHLNGTVYAGLGGDEKCFVAAMFFNPIQLTIASTTLSNIQNEILDTNKVDKKSKFKFAKIKNKNINIEEWV